MKALLIYVFGRSQKNEFLGNLELLYWFVNELYTIFSAVKIKDFV